MSFFHRIILSSSTLFALNATAEKLEVGSKDLSHIENVSSLKAFKPSPQDYRIYYIGDSITRHGFNKTTIKKLKWGHIAGMAASTEDKDFAHLLAKDIGAMLAGKKVRLFFGKGNNAVRALTGIPEARQYQPQLVVVQLGEHAKPSEGKVKVREDYAELLNALIDLKPQPLIICTGVWSIQTGAKKYNGWAADIEEIQKSVCREAGIPFASVEKYALDPKCSGTGGSGGVRWHPNDAGQAGYATAIFNLFKQYYGKAPAYKTIKTQASTKAAAPAIGKTGKVIYDENFNNGKSKMPVNPRSWKIADGSLSSFGNKMAAFKLRNLQLANFSLSCKLRLLSLPANKKDGHCGFIMSNGRGKTVRIYFRRPDVRLLIQEGRKSLLHTKLASYKEWKLSPNSIWNNIKLTVINGIAELNVNGNLAGNFKFPLNMVKELEIYSYIVDCGIDDFKLTQLPAISKVKRANADLSQPDFYANYNGSLAANVKGGTVKPLKANGTSFVPGVSGQAVMIGEKTKPAKVKKDKIKIKYYGGITFAKGELISAKSANSMGNCEISGLNAPAFTLKFSAKRLEVPDHGQHFGIVVKQADDRSVRFYFDGKRFSILHMDGKKKLRHEHILKDFTLTKGADAPWLDYSFQFAPDKIIVNLPGRKALTLPIKNAPATAMSIYAYKLAAAFKNITMTAPDGKLILGDTVFKNAAKKPARQGPALLEYPAGKLFGDSGTVMFWFKPNWDGQIKSRSTFPWYFLFYAENAKKQAKISMFMWNWLRCDLPREGLRPFSLQRKCRNAWLRDDWIHVAFTWNADGWNKLYVNGLPYEHGGGKREKPFRSNVSMGKIVNFCVGSLPGAGGCRKNADGAFDELKIYKAPLSDQAVMSEYHKYMPVEMVLERHYIPAGKAETLPLIVAPAGTFTNLPVKPVKCTVETRLINRGSGKTVWTKEFKLDLKKRQVIDLPAGALPHSVYHLQCIVKTPNGQSQQSFKVSAYQQQPIPAPTDQPVKLGKPFITVDCAKEASKALYNVKPQVVGNYLQAGTGHGSRFAFAVEFPDKYINKGPVMLEITWPDNVPRSMGLYMFPGITTFKQHRDRLEGGIQSGLEYPLTGKMVTSKYLFFPSVKKYLFEARTFVDDMPAAVVSFKALPLLEPLPQLKIDYPGKLPPRALGHMDEDQSYDYLMNWDHAERFDDFFPVKIVQKTCDYFAYTGQNMIAYPIMRYNYTLYSRPGYHQAKNLLKPGFINLFLDIMHRHNMGFIGTINQYSMPEFNTRPDKVDELTQQGLFIVNSAGRIKGSLATNPVHPLVRKQFMTQIKELLARFGNHPGFKGFDMWSRETWSFCSLKQGYGDYTVKLFSKETGIKVPDYQGPGRFAQRYEFLTGKVLAQWLKWRAEKTTAAIREVAAEMKKVNPKLILYVNPTGLFKHPDIEAAEDIANLNLEKFYYKYCSLDIKALNSIENAQVSAMRNVTGYRWRRHWDNAETVYDELLYKRDLWQPYRKNGMAPTWNYNRYFETFKNSLDPKNYKSYFQNADIKPWGRYFLKEWAHCLSQMDSDMMLIGAQPLGTAGRDDVTREFALAYRSLPALPFKDVPGFIDPVTVRYLNKNGKTWIYAVNTCWTPVTLELNNINSTAIDLSTRQKLSGGKLSIQLKPYQLRSFSLDGTVIPKNGKVIIDPASLQAMRKLIADARSKVAAIKKTGLNTQKYEKRLNTADAELKKGHCSVVMEILYSKLMRSLDHLGEAASKGFLKQQAAMLKRGHYAVNCGSAAMQYYKAADGTLFLPDRPYAPGAYGYSGSYKTVSRNVSKIKGTKDPSLFASEAYDIDEYLFTIKPGTYTVKLYFKHGWKPSAQPGKFVINVDIEGKRCLSKMDVFLESGSDFDRAFVKTIKNVKVKDGVLDIKFSVPGDVSSTARLCNAIEIIRQ